MNNMMKTNDRSLKSTNDFNSGSEFQAFNCSDNLGEFLPSFLKSELKASGLMAKHINSDSGSQIQKEHVKSIWSQSNCISDQISSSSDTCSSDVVSRNVYDGLCTSTSSSKQIIPSYPWPCDSQFYRKDEHVDNNRNLLSSSLHLSSLETKANLQATINPRNTIPEISEKDNIAIFDFPSLRNEATLDSTHLLKIDENLNHPDVIGSSKRAVFSNAKNKRRSSLLGLTINEEPESINAFGQPATRRYSESSSSSDETGYFGLFGNFSGPNRRRNTEPPSRTNGSISPEWSLFGNNSKSALFDSPLGDLNSVKRLTNELEWLGNDSKNADDSLNYAKNGKSTLGTKPVSANKFRRRARTSPQTCTSDANHSSNSENSDHDVKKVQLYKTELCRSFEETGKCKFGDKCLFAHGAEELREVKRHPRYKTEICKSYFEDGICKYGKRCCFLHDIPKNQ